MTVTARRLTAVKSAGAAGDKRDLILRAATRVFAQNGFFQSQVADVARVHARACLLALRVEAEVEVDGVDEPALLGEADQLGPDLQAQLLAQGGLYARLYREQFLAERPADAAEAVDGTPGEPAGALAD